METERAQQRPPNALGQAGESNQLVVLLLSRTSLSRRNRLRGKSSKDEDELICPLGQALLCRQLAAGLEIVTIAGVEGDVEFLAERLLQREVVEEYLAFADDLGGAALHHDGR